MLIWRQAHYFTLADTITYFTSIISIMHANFVVFPISPRNSALAVANLITKANIKHILVGQEQSMVDLAQKAIETVASQNSSTIAPTTSPLLLFAQLFSGNVVPEEDINYVKTAPEEIVAYSHSSGMFIWSILYAHNLTICRIYRLSKTYPINQSASNRMGAVSLFWRTRSAWRNLLVAWSPHVSCNGTVFP